MKQESEENIDFYIGPSRKVNYFSQIIRLEGRRNYTHIFLKGESDALVIGRTLKYFESKCLSFVRINKSVLINPTYVKEVLTEGSNKKVYITLVNEMKFEVSRRRINFVKKKLGCL